MVNDKITVRRLRKLLDSHGVRHRDFKRATMWIGARGEHVIAYPVDSPRSGRIHVKHYSLTPEQAIAVTLESVKN